MTDGLVPSDLLRIVTAADAQIAPDGLTVFYQKATFDAERDERIFTLHALRAGADERISNGPRDRLLRISADGSQVAFVRETSGGAQLHVADWNGNACRATGPVWPRISALAWSPSGRQIAVVSAASPAADASVYRDAASGALHIRAFPYASDGDGLHDGSRMQLFIVDTRAGTSRRLTSAAFDVETPCWSPDGACVAYASRVAGPDAQTNAAIFEVDVASDATRRISAGDGAASAPAYAPDGARVAYVGHRHGSDYRFALELFVCDRSGAGVRSLSAALDRPIGNMLCGDVRSGTMPIAVWSAGGTEIYALVTEGATCCVRAFASDDSGRTRIVAGGERDISSFALAANETLAIVYATPLEPSAVAALDRDGTERALTALNPWLADATLTVPERLAVHGDDGTALDAWLLAPPAQARTGALAIDIHPGPHAAFGFTFSLQSHVLAANGIAVVYGNPRGSHGYGQATAAAITGRWGELDAADILAIVDAAVAHGSYDPARVACLGQSYGGFLTTWLLGTTKRFAAGVSLDAVNDLLALYATSDVGPTIEREFATNVRIDRGRTLFERSPLRVAGGITAPLLIVHGDADERCPIDQAEGLFNTLRFFGNRTVEFVRLRGAGHELSRSGKPRQRVLRMRAVAHWLLRHLDAASSTDAAVAGALFAPLPGEA